MKISIRFAMVLVCLSGLLAPGASAAEAVVPANPEPGLVIGEVAYDARLDDDEGRFTVEVRAEALGKDGGSQTLFAGELGLLSPKLPSGLSIERRGDEYVLVASRPGRFCFKLEMVAKVKPAEPWNQVTFKGPATPIASLEAQAAGTNVDLQLLAGTLISSTQTNGLAVVKGFLGTDPTVSLRWSRAGGKPEVTRKALVTADTTVNIQITPTVIKYVTQLRYEILQGKASKLLLALPATQALTRLAGDQIRDWEIRPSSDQNRSSTDSQQVLEVQFIKPLEKEYQLTVYTEQTLDAAPGTVALAAPQPLEVERASGSLTLSAEDTLAELDAGSGLRQVNAAAGALAAYRFNSQPFTLGVKLRRIEPVISVAERISARVEETRLLSAHSLSLNVEKAGIYALDLAQPAGLVVADVRGDAVEDWKSTDAGTGQAKTMHVTFSGRDLGARKLEVQLEEPLKPFPEHVGLGALRVVGASKEISEVGVGSAPGIRVKTAELSELREVPVRTLQGRHSPGTAAAPDELLAYKSDQPDWKLTLSTERLAARIVAEVFNLITIGDGIVGGSATIRYGMVNQGVQEFRLAVPAPWKNVEFTGPNIRRKELRPDGTWIIGLQDKAWDGYTLVVTYDFQFDPKGAVLPVGGLHPRGVEREQGSVAVTTAASLKLTAQTVSDSLRHVDELELSAVDRALITRSVVLAYQYNGDNYDLRIDVKRFAEANVLSAVADRTQLTTVLTERGQMVTQASFIVKNNDKQFQRFKLPTGADFWSCHVNGQPVKAERDGDWLLAPLPRAANRDQAFAVDLVYVQKKGIRAAWLPQQFTVEAPQTDVPNTYAEWQVFAPAVFRLSGFAGNMIPVRGTTYDLQDGWQMFTRFYWDFLREAGPGLLLLVALIGLMLALVASAIRRGAQGVLTVLAIFGIVAILAAMLLPALAKAKGRAQSIMALNNLKQIGLAARTWALDNNDRLPNSFEEMMPELSTDKVTYDPESGQRFVYIGGGLEVDKIQPDSVICYSPNDTGGWRNVLLADGSVQRLTGAKFEELSRRGWIVPATAQQIAQNQQLAAVHGAQFQPATAQPLAPVQPANGPANLTPTAPAAQPQPGVAPVPASGGPRVRAIRIEIPREGQAFTFTKILNMGQQALAVQVKIMQMRTFQILRTSMQVLAFLTGVLVCVWQWRRARNSIVLTLGLALALGAVGHLLLAWRLLHVAFIWTAPILLLAALAWLTWRFWPRPAEKAEAGKVGLEPGLPPAVAAIALLLWSSSASASEPTAPVPSVSVVSASYVGSVSDQVAQLDATLVVRTSSADQRLCLFGDDVAVQEFSTKPAGGKLVREGKGVAALLPRRGQVTLQLKLVAKLGGDITRRRLTLGVPGALTSRLALTIDQPEADVEFPGAVSVKRSSTQQQTSVQAVLGASDRIELLWTPRVKRAAEIAANVICQNTSLVNIGGGVLHVRTILDYQVTQGEMRQVRVRLPAGYRLLRVEGESIRTWEVKTEESEPTLVVDLLKGIASTYRLTVETEKVLGQLPAVVTAEVPHALATKRETGAVGLRAEDELELTLDRTAELYRIDVEEFGRLAGGKFTGPFNAFRFLKPDFSLQARVAALRPQIEATVRNNLRVGQDQVNLSAAIDYVIKRAGVFSLQVALPAGYRLESTKGTNILQSVERSAGDQRLLEITLEQRTSGDYTVQLELTKTFKEIPKTLPVAGVHPLGIEKLTGFVSVSVEPGVAIKPAAAEGLTEIPAASLGGSDGSLGSGALAYKFITTEPQIAPGWSLSVETEAIEAWVRAELVNTLTISDSLVSGQAVARFDIQNAPVKELKLRIPLAFQNVEISGPNIRRRDHDGEVWRVEFQSRIKGPHLLTVNWEQPRTSQTNLLELGGIAAEGVERETGILTIVARPPLQITERNAGDLKPIDLRDLPDWAGTPDEATVLAYRYLRPGYTLALDATRFRDAQALQALVEHFNLTTVVADDGQTMTSMSLAVRHQGRQHLEVTLPVGEKLWSAFVAGQPVRPSVKDGKLLLPLEQAASDDAAVNIDCVYVGTNAFPQKHGAIQLLSPTLDAPWQRARWELFLPPDYEYSGFGGSMAHEVEKAILEPSSYSFLDYSSRESKNRAELAQELKSDITRAKKKLSSGNVKEALADYSRARSKSDAAAANNAEAKQLEADLRRAQGNNLIQAQTAFSFSNSGQLPESLLANRIEPTKQYDAATAEAQWTKLQQAQDLAKASVQPIRVSLPTRGLHHSFTQVLQTEPGQALTLRLVAENSRLINWPKRIGGTLAALVGLWAIVSLITRRAPRQQSTVATA
jgi:hypothetical protein